METATPSDLPFAAADTASGERWISLRELAEARGVSQHSATRLVRRSGQPEKARALRAAISVTAADVAVDCIRRP